MRERIRVMLVSFTLEKRRVQGMPGAGRTHGPPATKKAGGSHHRFSRTSGIPCAMVLTVSFVLSPGTGFLAPVISAMRKHRRKT
jgi:hypothetical protein